MARAAARTEVDGWVGDEAGHQTHSHGRHCTPGRSGRKRFAQPGSARGHRPIDRLDLRDARREREPARILPRALGHPRAQRPVLDELDQRRPEPGRARGLAARRRRSGRRPRRAPSPPRPGPRSRSPAVRPPAPRPGRAPGSRCATRRRRGRRPAVGPAPRGAGGRPSGGPGRRTPAARRRRPSSDGPPPMTSRRTAAARSNATAAASRMTSTLFSGASRPSVATTTASPGQPASGRESTALQRPDAVDVDAGRDHVHPVATVLGQARRGSRRRGRSTARRSPRSAPRSAAGRHRSAPMPGPASGPR